MEEWAYSPAKDQSLRPSDRFRSVRREIGLIAATTCALRWAMVRGYVRSVHRLRIEGRENLPQQLPFILVGNHASHLDALVLSAVLPLSMNHRVFPIAAGDTFIRDKATAAFASLFLNILPIARDGSGGGPLIALRERMLGDSCGFILFPEGTRSRTGEMARFKAGIGMLVAGTSVPVVPYHLEGCYEAWPPSQRLPRPRAVSTRIGRPLTFPDVENHRGGWISIAAVLEAAVRNLARHKTANVLSSG